MARDPAANARRAAALPARGGRRDPLDADLARRPRARPLRGRQRDRQGRPAPAERGRARDPRPRAGEAVRRARADARGGDRVRALPHLAAQGGLREAAGAAARVLRAGADRRARLAAHLRRAGAGRVPARGARRGRRQRAADRPHRRRARRALADARRGLADRATGSDRRELDVPSQRGRRLPRDPRPRGRDAHRAPGGPLRRARRAGVPARATDAGCLPAAQPRPDRRLATRLLREHPALHDDPARADGGARGGAARRVLALPQRLDHPGDDRRVRALPGAAVRPDRALQRVARRVSPGPRGARQGRRAAAGGERGQRAARGGRAARRRPARARRRHLRLRGRRTGRQERLAEPRRGRARRARRRHGRWQVDARRSCSPASTTRSTARSGWAASTCATRRSSRCATGS